MQENSGVVSTQVLQENVVAAIGKLHQDPRAVLRQILLLEALEVILRSTSSAAPWALIVSAIVCEAFSAMACLAFMSRDSIVY